MPAVRVFVLLEGGIGRAAANREAAWHVVDWGGRLFSHGGRGAKPSVGVEVCMNETFAPGLTDEGLEFRGGECVHKAGL